MINQLKYHKIRSSLPQEGKQGTRASSWCVTEKVHGANFSFHIHRSGKLKCGKRTGIIEDDDSFFGYFAVVERVRQSIFALAEELFSAHPLDTSPLHHDADGDAPDVVLFGELFGGEYPGVSCSGRARAVQQGVWYSPRVKFMLVDICVAMPTPPSVSPAKGCSTVAQLYFLPFREVLRLAAKHGVFCAEPLLVGSQSAVTSFDINFPSTIPSRLGLSPLPPGEENLAEGVVVRPLDGPPVAFHEAAARPIAKSKTASFRDGEGCPPEITGLEHICYWLLSLVDPDADGFSSLLASACSKVGELEDRRHWAGVVSCMLDDLAEQTGDPVVFEQMADELRFKLFNILAASHCKEDISSGI